MCNLPCVGGPATSRSEALRFCSSSSSRSWVSDGAAGGAVGGAVSGAVGGAAGGAAGGADGGAASGADGGDAVVLPVVLPIVFTVVLTVVLSLAFSPTSRCFVALPLSHNSATRPEASETTRALSTACGSTWLFHAVRLDSTGCWASLSS